MLNSKTWHALHEASLNRMREYRDLAQEFSIDGAGNEDTFYLSWQFHWRAVRQLAVTEWISLRYCLSIKLNA